MPGAWWCAAAGGLVLLVRCLRGVSSCWCAAAGGLVVLVRGPRGVWACWCAAPGGSGLAGALPRLVLGVVSERASTGRVGGAAALVLGPWPSLDARFCVRAWGAKASASTTGSRHQRRSVRPRAREGRSVGAHRGGVGSANADPVPTPAPTRSPRPQTSAVASRPVEALAERRTSRSRASAAPPQQRAAPTQPHPESKPHQRSPSRERSRADDVRRPGPAVARPGGGRSPCAGRR